MTTETVTDRTILEALDFDHEIACEGAEWHKIYGDGAAVFIIDILPRCGCSTCRSVAICAGCWISMGREALICLTCDRPAPRDECIHIVRVLGGAS